MSDYSEECAGSITSGQDTYSPEYTDHEYNPYYDYTSDRSTDESYRPTRNGGGGGGKNNKFEDAGYNKVRRALSGKKNNVFVEFYETSSTPNMYIRDAISGAIRSPYRTGSPDEDLFFSVRLATGESRHGGGANLFYDNPEQYERHFQTSIPDSIKDRWREKVNMARIRHSIKIEESKKVREIIVK